MHTWFILKLLRIAFAVLWAGSLAAQTLSITDMPQGPLGLHARVLYEHESALGIDAVLAPQLQQQFQPGERAVLNGGIGARPAWVHLQVNNGQAQALVMRLAVGTTWLDHLDVFLVQEQRVLASWKTGDEVAGAPGLQAGIGFEFDMPFPPGSSDIYLRAESVDPLVLPIALRIPAQADQDRAWVHYSYGLLYGFLIALIAYNGMLFIGLKDRSYLYYAGYLIAMIGMNMAYTGHGLAWLWPGQVALQRYAILGLMVAFGSSGLLFAGRLLALKEHAPGVQRALSRFSVAVIAAFALCVVLGSHRGAVVVAFAFAAAFTVLMLVLGVLTVRQQRASGRYFLWAVSFGTLGAMSTLLAVLCTIGFSTMTFRGAEIGVSLEAALLALALAAQMRQHQRASVRAEHLANHDPLTGLYNRRAFLERLYPVWATAKRGNRPLSLILLDLDHFKRINDVHGHDVGDLTLQQSAQLLFKSCRAGDLLARWGGEEFVLLLPEADLEQARAFAERLRLQFEETSVAAGATALTVTASFGVAQLGAHAHPQELIKDADVALYEAKHAGRNRVCVAPPQPTDAAGAPAQSSLASSINTL